MISFGLWNDFAADNMVSLLKKGLAQLKMRRKNKQTFNILNWAKHFYCISLTRWLLQNTTWKTVAEQTLFINVHTILFCFCLVIWCRLYIVGFFLNNMLTKDRT